MKKGKAGRKDKMIKYNHDRFTITIRTIQDDPTSNPFMVISWRNWHNTPEELKVFSERLKIVLRANSEKLFEGNLINSEHHIYITDFSLYHKKNAFCQIEYYIYLKKEKNFEEIYADLGEMCELTLNELEKTC